MAVETYLCSAALRSSLAGLALLILGGCLPESENPIAAADPVKTDPRLWGSWLSEEEDGFSIAHVFALEDGKLQIAFAEHDVEGVGTIQTYEGHATQLPSGDYLNALVTGEESGYVIGKYEFSGTNTVSIAFVNSQALEQAIKDGKLKGTITPETGGNDVRITATSAEWQAYLAGAPAGLFGESSSFNRVGPAYVEQQ
jgi:hypothetical protein